MGNEVTRRETLGLLAVAATVGVSSFSVDEIPALQLPSTEKFMPDLPAIYDSIIRVETKDDLPVPTEDDVGFAVTDAGAYEWDEKIEEWRQLPLGTAENPLPPMYPTRERIKDRSVYGHRRGDFAAGRVSAMRWASWPMQVRDTITSYPVNKTRPVLMFHSEGMYPVEYTETFPRMKERGIPWMMGATPRRFGHGLDHDQVMEMLLHGCEISLYTGKDGNLDEDAADIDDLEEILLEQKRKLERMGFPVQHMQPRQGSGINTDDIDEPKSYMTRSAFAASGHGYAEPDSNGPSAVGNIAQHGVASVKIEDKDMSADEAKAIIDRLVKTNDRLRFFFHSHNIEDWTRLEQILDYAAKKRQQGELDLATSTGGLVIPWDFPDGDIVNDSDATFAETFEEGVWSAYGAAPEVRTAGGPTGGNYWAMGWKVSGNSPSGLFEQNITLNPTFPAGMVDFRACAPAGDATVTVRLDSFGTDALRGKTFDTHRTLDSSWTREFVPFGCPRADAGSGRRGGWRLALFTTDAEVHISDIKIYPC